MSKIHVSTTVNGDDVQFLCDPRETLLDCLRDKLNLTGAKEGCGTGDCGACSFVGHLAGIMAGLLIGWGFFAWVTPFWFISSLVRAPACCAVRRAVLTANNSARGMFCCSSP